MHWSDQARGLASQTYLKREYIMVRKAIAVMLAAGTLLVAGCNTVHGAGKDVSSAGNAISNAAK